MFFSQKGKYENQFFGKTKKYAVVFIRDYIARTVDYIPELDEMKNVLSNNKKK